MADGKKKLLTGRETGDNPRTANIRALKRQMLKPRTPKQQEQPVMPTVKEKHRTEDRIEIILLMWIRLIN